MRINICLYGRFNNRLSKTAGAEGYEEIRSLIKEFPQFEFRIWAYSNDLENSEEIRQLYEPLGARLFFERAPDFKALINESHIEEADFTPPEKSRGFESTFAFLYSRKKVLDIMCNSDEATDADWVVISRFDSGQIDRFNGRQRDKVSSIGFNRYLKKGYVYSALWEQHNLGYADQWFICSLEDSKILSNMYLSLGRYFADPSSRYIRHIEEGVVDSNKTDAFSNERLKGHDQKTEQLQSIPAKKALNNHLLHKFYFLETGLYQKSRFTASLGDLSLVTYSHNEYREITRVFYESVEEHFNCFKRRYLISNMYNHKFAEQAEQVIYNEAENYVDRLIQGLVQVESDYILFCHEDMVLTGQPSMRHVQDAFQLVKSGRLDYFSFARGGIQVGTPILGLKSVNKYLNWLSPWIFSIQPSIWNKRSLISLLQHHRGMGIWEFEAAAQKTFRKKGLRGGFSRKKGRKRGSLHWDTPLFPFIATLVVKGELNWKEYPDEVEELCQSRGLPWDWKKARN